MRHFIVFIIALSLCACSSQPSWEYIAYHPDGSLKIMHGVSDSRAYLDSTFIRYEFYPSGYVMSRGEFLNGELNNQLIGFYDAGKIGAIHGYLEGKYHGEVIDYYEDGRVKSLYQYDRNYTLSGGEFFPNGQSMGDLTFTSGRLSKGVYYYPSGNLRSQGSWRYNKKVGTWYTYDSLGIVIDSTFYPDPVGDRIKEARKEK